MPRWNLLGELGPVTTLAATVRTLKNQFAGPGQTARSRSPEEAQGICFQNVLNTL